MRSVACKMLSLLALVTLASGLRIIGGEASVEADHLVTLCFRFELADVTVLWYSLTTMRIICVLSRTARSLNSACVRVRVCIAPKSRACEPRRICRAKVISGELRPVSRRDARTPGGQETAFESSYIERSNNSGCLRMSSRLISFLDRVLLTKGTMSSWFE